MKFQNCFQSCWYLLLTSISIVQGKHHKKIFYRPFARTNYGKFSIKFFASQLWETIPVSVKLLSFKILKRNIRNFYSAIKRFRIYINICLTYIWLYSLLIKPNLLP